MGIKLSVYLDDVDELDRLISLAAQWGYTRVVMGTRVANLSAFVRAIANGEVEVSRREKGRDRREVL